MQLILFVLVRCFELVMPLSLYSCWRGGWPRGIYWLHRELGSAISWHLARFQENLPALVACQIWPVPSDGTDGADSLYRRI